MGGGVFFCKKVENCFPKKWTFPQRRMHYVHYQYFLFYILHIWGWGAYFVRAQRTRPCLRACTISPFNVKADAHLTIPYVWPGGVAVRALHL